MWGWTACFFVEEYPAILEEELAKFNLSTLKLVEHLHYTGTHLMRFDPPLQMQEDTADKDGSGEQLSSTELKETLKSNR